jgi:hypothetical protein
MLLAIETWRLSSNVAEYREEFSGNVGQTEHTGVLYVMPFFIPDNRP